MNGEEENQWRKVHRTKQIAFELVDEPGMDSPIVFRFA